MESTQIRKKRSCKGYTLVELMAVIAAAVAAAMEQAGEENTTGFVVRSIRRINNAPAWNRAGREEQVYSRM